MAKIFKKYKITTLINLSIFNISNNSIDDAILSALRDKYECKVTKYGYIKENSIEVIKRSAGISMKEHFNSSFNFKAICYVLICNPSIDNVLNATITSSNNAGYKAEVKDGDKVIIDIIIPRLTAGIKHEYDIEDLEIGKEVFVKICRKRYHFADTKIVIIGLVINDPNMINVNEADEVEDLVEKEQDKDIEDDVEELVIESEEEEEDDDSVVDLSIDTTKRENIEIDHDIDEEYDSDGDDDILDEDEDDI
tara:strand:- start:34 stop:786 length:753 start_codon:yes stop_codon:yes gene_type:complete